MFQLEELLNGRFVRFIIWTESRKKTIFLGYDWDHKEIINDMKKGLKGRASQLEMTP